MRKLGAQPSERARVTLAEATAVVPAPDGAEMDTI